MEPVLAAIIEQEVETLEYLDTVAGRLDVTQKRLRLMARRIYLLCREGKMTPEEARKAFVRGFTALSLAEYAHDAPKLQEMTDRHLSHQVDAVKALPAGKRVSTLGPVRKLDIKARASAKAEAAAKQKSESEPGTDDGGTSEG